MAGVLGEAPGFRAAVRTVVALGLGGVCGMTASVR